MKKFYTCKQCGKIYTSRKEHSEFCSIECKNTYYRYFYNCDYCGKEIIIYKNEYEKLKTGKKKHKYCSKECANNGLITSLSNKCKNCGKTFKVVQSLKDKNLFCCKTCFDTYRENNARKNITRICPICKNIFYSERKNPIFCSLECSQKSQQKREQCSCNYCGKSFERIISEINKNEKHYCSKMCKQLDQKWSDQDVQILIDNYNKMPNKDIIPLLSKPYTEKAIKSEAGRRDLWKSRLWSDDETNALIELYPTVPMNQILSALPNRSVCSICSKARVLGLKSWFYINSTYSDYEIEFIKSNYLSMTNAEIGDGLGRNANAIQQRIWLLGLQRPFDPKSVCYKDIASYIRGQNATWRNHIFKENDYTCYLTGKRGNVVVHHCHGFNLLLQETIDNTNFEIKDKFCDYSDNELFHLYECFFELQDYYGEYVCINKDVHVLFHKNYGYGNNTMEQWKEFEKDFLDGKYNKTA